MAGVTLDTIGGGALAELFAVELARILSNIADPNMDAKAKRSMTLTVTFRPSRDRDVADVALTRRSSPGSRRSRRRCSSGNPKAN